ncbi:hypothetical protein BN59_02793 [Legionella massiliensis]|uniref:Uncharacterized protein n=1 Tax=Legionella massiliensis TaxID=1034943 RepID=A0A078L3G7_9GAMM|nr:hypothetical protein [Legionella massiliensis]CDZ78483.1 hypothetical protein BN59_02793 [Legionella massiliensis]CEE14221.1 hypothetical protein BN1094_02793 [Legionella massiliensis]
MTLFDEIKTRLIIIAATTFVVIAIILLIYSIHLKNQLIDSYQLSFKLWESQKPNNYLLNYSSRGCEYTVKVTDGVPKIIKPTALNNINCVYTPQWLEAKQPMTALFKDLLQLNYPNCGPNGCICDNINYLTLSFDKSLGYIQSWKETNSGRFNPYLTAGSLSLACTLIYAEPIDFSVDIRPI